MHGELLRWQLQRPQDGVHDLLTPERVGRITWKIEVGAHFGDCLLWAAATFPNASQQQLPLSLPHEVNQLVNRLVNWLLNQFIDYESR